MVIFHYHCYYYHHVIYAPRHLILPSLLVFFFFSQNFIPVGSHELPLPVSFGLLLSGSKWRSPATWVNLHLSLHSLLGGSVV